MPNAPLRIVIDEDAFRKLVAGKSVNVAARWRRIEMLQVEIILADIGWGSMIDAVADALADSTTQMEREEVLGILRTQFWKR